MVTEDSPRLKELEMAVHMDPILRWSDMDMLDAQEEFLRFQADTLEVLRLTILYMKINRNIVGRWPSAETSSSDHEKLEDCHISS